MSHIFISYSSNDEEIRNLLIDNLQNHFSLEEIWFDKDKIGGGLRWSNEIDIGLEQSFCLIVIVTQNSMQSLYVTYEWSWALGFGIRVIPVYFDKIPANSHKRLQDLHWYNMPSEQTKLIEILLSLKNEASAIRRIKDKLQDSLIPTLTFLKTFFFLNDYAIDRQLEYEKFMAISEKAFWLIRETYTGILPDVILNYHGHLPNNLRRKIDSLVNSLEAFWNLFNPYNTHIRNYHLHTNYLKEEWEEQYRQLSNYWIENVRSDFIYFAPTIDLIVSNLFSNIENSKGNPEGIAFVMSKVDLGFLKQYLEPNDFELFQDTLSNLIENLRE